MRKNWFIRWAILVTVLISISVLVWWYILEDRRPDEFWLVLLYIGVGAIFIGGLMIIGASESKIKSDSEFSYSSLKAPGTKDVDFTKHMDNRILWWLEASPAIWAFVLIGIITVIIGFVIKALT